MKGSSRRMLGWLLLLGLAASCASVDAPRGTPAATGVLAAGVPENPRALDAAIRARIAASNAQRDQAFPARRVGWSSVAVGGSGYITGLLIHPRAKDVMYAKIDIGGVFRWEAKTKSWTSLMDFLPTERWNDYGSESVALDPSDPDVLYVATGNYDQEWADDGKIYRSSDRGRSWTKISPDEWGVKMGGGQFRRGTGERLAVSPSDPEVILFGSRRDGLWRTEDGGRSWQQQTFTGLEPNLGIQSLLFDPKTPGLVYGTFNGLGVYRSDDDGKTWNEVPGGPTVGMRLALTSRPGELWVTYDAFPGLADGGVAKLAQDGSWELFYPAGAPVGAYGALAVDPFDDDHVLVAPTETYAPGVTYRTRDGGRTWQEVAWNYVTTVPYVTGHKYGDDGWFQAEQAAYVFDPHRRDTFWLTNWFFTSVSTDLQSDRPTLTNYAYNQETTVNLALATNAAGELLSGTADVSGFYHDRGLATYPSGQFPELAGQTPIDGQTYAWNNTTGLAAFEGDRDVLFRTGSVRDFAPNGLAKSADGGRSWTLLKEWEVTASYDGKPLRVAVSPTDANNLVVTRFNAPTQVTRDGGQTWADAAGAGVTPNNLFYWGQPLVADGARAATFYYYDDTSATVARSDDGGQTFKVVAAGLENGSAGDRHGYLEATPGEAGDLWLALEDAGLYHSTDAGGSWTRLANVTQAWNVAVGKAAHPGLPHTLYVYGKVAGQKGIWMSTNLGKSWYNLQHPRLQIGALPNNLEASRDEFGRLYVGTVGRGVFTLTLGFGAWPRR